MTHAEAVQFLMDRVKAEDFHGNYRLCPYPGTKEVFKTDKVHVLICMSCRYAVRYKYHGGVGCSYGKDENG